MRRPLLRTTTGRLLVEAHGGSSSSRLNSWAAIRGGLSSGADLIEVDVQTSRDGIPFLFHNYTLPPSDGRWTHDLSWHELRALRFDGHSLPPLEDVLSWADESGAFLVLDIKSGFRPAGSAHGSTASLVASLGAADRVLMSDRDHHEIAATKRSNPDIRTRAAIGARLTQLAAVIDDVGPDVITMRWDLCRKTDVELAHDRGVAVTFVDGWHEECVGAALQLGADMVSWPDAQAAKALIRLAGARQ